jgi:formylglycine-generating enzyme required for sulfatase activity
MRGPSYPWGDEAPQGGRTTTCDRAHFNQCAGDDRRPTRRVGRFASAGGLFDMAGNVAEWTADNYQVYAAIGTCRMSTTDPLCILDPAGARVVRGGAFFGDIVSIRAASRLMFGSATRDAEIGFRCARTLP